MGTPEIRNEEHFNSHQAVRKLLVDHAPGWDDDNGLVVTDLDMVFRYYGPDYGTDAYGRFWICEAKKGLHSRLTGGQYHLFKQMDGMLRSMKMNMPRYFGFWLLNYDCADDGTELQLIRMTEQFRQHPRQIEGHNAIFEAICTGVL